MAERDILDPHGNYIFSLQIDEIAVAQFFEISGIKSTTNVVEVEEGGVNYRVHKLPGQSRWENVVLRFGVSVDTSIAEWRQEILDDKFGNRKNVSIVLYDMAMAEVRRWELKNAWPVAYEGPQLNAQGSELAIEMIELAHEGIEIKSTA